MKNFILFSDFGLYYLATPTPTLMKLRLPRGRGRRVQAAAQQGAPDGPRGKVAAERSFHLPSASIFVSACLPPPPQR